MRVRREWTYLGQFFGVGLPAVFCLFVWLVGSLFCCMVRWFGPFVVWLVGLVLLLYGWLVWFFCCMVCWFGSFVVWLTSLVLLLCG